MSENVKLWSCTLPATHIYRVWNHGSSTQDDSLGVAIVIQMHFTMMLRTVYTVIFTVVQDNLSVVDTTGTLLAVLYTVEPLYRGHHWDPAGCPVYSGTSL